MGAFCVFGVSRAYCRDQAERKTFSHDNETIVEWAARRDALATQLFEECEKPVRISPEFDAPQFARDWMSIAPNEIKLAKVMVRGPKLDGGGQADKAPRRSCDDLGRVSTHPSIHSGLRMKKIYIAGPMTGLPELNFPAFHAAAAQLRAAGHTAINPAEINPDTTATWTDCMKADIAQLVTCDTIYLLPGWENSRGAKLEHHIASELGINVIRVAA